MADDVIDQTGRLFDDEGDEVARTFFSPRDLEMSPEEYAARHAHEWGCYSFHRYHYRDAALGDWVRRLGEILIDEAELERCRQRFLTSEELATVRSRQREGF